MVCGAHNPVDTFHEPSKRECGSEGFNVTLRLALMISGLGIAHIKVQALGIRTLCASALD